MLVHAGLTGRRDIHAFIERRAIQITRAFGIFPNGNTNPNTVRSALLGVAVISWVIDASKVLGALETCKAPAFDRFSAAAYGWTIAAHKAIIRRIIDTGLILLAVAARFNVDRVPGFLDPEVGYVLESNVGVRIWYELALHDVSATDIDGTSWEPKGGHVAFFGLCPVGADRQFLVEGFQEEPTAQRGDAFTEISTQKKVRLNRTSTAPQRA
jgi:hypothetical protein